MDVIGSVDVYSGVAPLVGAWIEIPLLPIAKISSSVAPLVGAWIEISVSSNRFLTSSVAPLVGAWIEMFLHERNSALFHGRSPRGSVD